MCGGRGFRCCRADDGAPSACSDLEGSSVCLGGVCAACGGRSEVCCSGGACGPTASCNEVGVCELNCGAEGLPCCGTVTSSSQACPLSGSTGLGIDVTCVSGVCTACGGLEQPCCLQNTGTTRACRNLAACDPETQLCRVSPGFTLIPGPPLPEDTVPSNSALCLRPFFLWGVVCRPTCI